jgi:hypothetical protein
MKKILKPLLTTLLLLLPFPTHAADFKLELESGPAWQSRNNVRIPNDTGDRFDISDFSSGPFLTYRITGEYTLKDRHVFRAIIAPLQIRESGIFTEPVSFQGETYNTDSPTTVRYKFNSYRLGYRYVVHDTARWNIQLGGTLKMRDAKVRLYQDGKNNRNTDVGFVPLLSGRVSWQASHSFTLVWDIEGLGASQGRAIDSLIGITYHLDPSIDITAGYRTLEGGADNDEVYTFSWIHYAVISLGIRF